MEVMNDMGAIEQAITGVAPKSVEEVRAAVDAAVASPEAKALASEISSKADKAAGLAVGTPSHELGDCVAEMDAPRPAEASAPAGPARQTEVQEEVQASADGPDV